jgi:hypothetical protein
MQRLVCLTTLCLISTLAICACAPGLEFKEGTGSAVDLMKDIRSIQEPRKIGDQFIDTLKKHRFDLSIEMMTANAKLMWDERSLATLMNSFEEQQGFTKWIINDYRYRTGGDSYKITIDNNGKPQVETQKGDTTWTLHADLYGDDHKQNDPGGSAELKLIKEGDKWRIDQFNIQVSDNN